MPSRLSAAYVFTAIVVLGSSAAALEVRVDTTGGVPRLIVDGRPVRARIFWGAPGSAPLPIGPDARTVSFEFTATGSATTGTLHFRFGETPGEAWLDDIRLVDLDAPGEPLIASDFETGEDSFRRDWTSWPTGAANTVGRVEPARDETGRAALRVQLAAPPAGPWPDFHIYHLPRLRIVEGHRYRVRFQARATPAREIVVAIYRPGAEYVRLGGPDDPFLPQIQLAAEAGVSIVSFPIDTPWPRPGEPAGWSAVDSVCSRVLQANPQALLLPRMGLDPPPWWREAHPDAVMQWEDGRRDAAVVASPAYRRDAAATLTDLIEHLEDTFGDHIAGYHPCGQNTGEWFYHDTWKSLLNGYAPADLAAWRSWLAERYKTDETLGTAWADPTATFAAAVVPSPAARHAAPSGVLRNPASERPLIDWSEFQQQAMAECVADLAHAARMASRGRKLVVFFYGYGFEFGAVENGPATSGHYALRRLLDCPDIDVLCSPISYHDRGLGQGAPAMSAAESVALAGKLWITEDDTHTYLATGMQPGSADHAADLTQSTAMLERNLAQAALRNFGTWWMDLGATGWFNDPALWAPMMQLEPLDRAMLEYPTPYRPEVAAVLDERTMMYVAAGGARAMRPLLYESRTALGRMAAPYGQFLLDDVVAGRVQARLYVFLNAWCLDAAQRSRLLDATRGAAKVWCYAPGILEPDRLADPAAAQPLTGFTLVPVRLEKALATPTAAGRRVGLTKPFGIDAAVEPLYAAADAQRDEVLATYADGSAAVALRRTESGPSLFVGPPRLTPELLRIAADAGLVHLFTRTDCNVYASGRYLALHAAQDGPVELDTGTMGPVIDLLTSTPIGRGPRLRLELRKGETRVLRY